MPEQKGDFNKAILSIAGGVICALFEGLVGLVIAGLAGAGGGALVGFVVGMYLGPYFGSKTSG